MSVWSASGSRIHHLLIWMLLRNCGCKSIFKACCWMLCPKRGSRLRFVRGIGANMLILYSWMGLFLYLLHDHFLSLGIRNVWVTLLDGWIITIVFGLVCRSRWYLVIEVLLWEWVCLFLLNPERGDWPLLRIGIERLWVKRILILIVKLAVKLVGDGLAV